MKVSRTILFLFSVFIITQASARMPSVTIRVNAPESTPADARLYLAGNDSSMGNWNPSEAGMTREHGVQWVFTGNYEKGTKLEFKITLGAWSRQAMYGGKGIPGNFRLTVEDDTTIILSPEGWSDPSPAVLSGGITGLVEYHRGLAGKDLRYTRDLIVWLPPSYPHEPARRYPVLYLHDGQNIIDPATSFLGADWRVDEVADSLIRAGSIEELIIVGINNSPDRTAEYSETALGRAYGEFVVTKVKPMIDSLYRTKPDKNNTAVMGSSMGGLISFLFAWEYPEVFSKAGCLSPAFLVDSNRVLTEVQAYKGPKKGVRLYLDDGGVGIDARLKPGYEKMVQLLAEKGYMKGVDLDYFYDPPADHNEHAWAHRLWRPLIFMFGKK
jgi:predicted alpha/beta superfamily hydrolase